MAPPTWTPCHMWSPLLGDHFRFDFLLLLLLGAVTILGGKASKQASHKHRHFPNPTPSGSPGGDAHGLDVLGDLNLVHHRLEIFTDAFAFTLPSSTASQPIMHRILTEPILGNLGPSHLPYWAVGNAFPSQEPRSWARLHTPQFLAPLYSPQQLWPSPFSSSFPS